jgi:hypothetical protein
MDALANEQNFSRSIEKCLHGQKTIPYLLIEND